MRIALLVFSAVFLGAGCTINQGMIVKRVAHYNAQGQLTGYTVEETLALPEVRRPSDRAQSEVKLFETGTTFDRVPAHWPPPKVGTSLRTAENRK